MVIDKYTDLGEVVKTLGNNLVETDKGHRAYIGVIGDKLRMDRKRNITVAPKDEKAASVRKAKEEKATSVKKEEDASTTLPLGDENDA